MPAATKKGRPVVLEGLPKEGPIRWGFREIKMLRPICDVCAPNTAKAKKQWWLECPHDPYVGTRTFKSVEREYADEIDDKTGEPTGARIVSGTVERAVERPWPNLVQISHSTMHNMGSSVDKARTEKGYILPSELESEAYPNGIARFCEFRECFNQKGLKRYGETFVCREEEALRIYESESGVTIELHNGKKRNEQIGKRLAEMRAVTS